MYSDEYYLNQLSYFLVFIPIFARKYTIMITEELQKLYLAPLLLKSFGLLWYDDTHYMQYI